MYFKKKLRIAHICIYVYCKICIYIYMYIHWNRLKQDITMLDLDMTQRLGPGGPRVWPMVDTYVDTHCWLSDVSPKNNRPGQHFYEDVRHILRSILVQRNEVIAGVAHLSPVSMAVIFTNFRLLKGCQLMGTVGQTDRMCCIHNGTIMAELRSCKGRDRVPFLSCQRTTVLLGWS